MRRDVHMHLERGSYTREYVDRFVEKAVAEGLTEIWLLEHTHRFREFLPLYEHLKAYGAEHVRWVGQKGQHGLLEYLDLVSEMQKQSFPISIKWGLEVCYFPGQEDFIEKEMKSLGMDFLVGSVHWIDGFGFDQKPELWEGHDVDAEYRRYYEIMKELIASGLFDGLAHPDSIKCYGAEASYDLTETYETLAEGLNRQQMYTEQSSGLYHNYHYPKSGMNPELLHVLCQNGVRIETASDAHRPEDVGNRFVEMEEALQKEGYRH